METMIKFDCIVKLIITEHFKSVLTNKTFHIEMKYILLNC
uniref:Uncharacterized protein n=1 Tax=Lepeophtheirus salmonis TaxID=72036 RepID=A0A0K2TZI2_LEPSM